MFDLMRQFILDSKTGAVARSSEEFANLIADTANLSNAQTVVELGPGTGTYTEKILERISDDTVFFSLEINPFFVKEAKKRCPSAIVYQDSAANVNKYLKKHGVDGCDCIISGLPWACFDRELQENLLRAIVDALNPGGEFVASACLPGILFLPTGKRFRNMLGDRFKKVTTSGIVWKNIPPALVYYCKK
ncbi:MAG: rRNA adenine N-6-methyltransferase family protein [archaeon]|nr:rRNA adenine N-6-methyltransferase family protein [archaeon]